MWKFTLLVWLLGLVSPAWASEFNLVYDPTARAWSLSNSAVTAQVELSSNGQFRLRSFSLKARPSLWTADESRNSSPIRFVFDQVTYNGSTSWTLLSQDWRCPGASSCALVLTLQDAAHAVEVELSLSLYAGQPVLRHEIAVTSLKANLGYLTSADMLPYSLSDDQPKSYRVMRVNQWAISPHPTDFETSHITLLPNGSPVKIQSGAHGVQCSWFAVQDQDGRGLFAGWEFDGLAAGAVRQMLDGNYLQLRATVSDLHHPLEPGRTFRIPAAFIGIYSGDWDEGAYRTQRFVEKALSKPAADDRFPYMVWDSWAYQTALEETVLRREAANAAELGVELFIIDLGWAERLGDWQADKAKFPSGLRALSDYVHGLGMKFGIHFAFAEADANSQVLLDHPDWTSTEDDGYFGARSLCLSNRPARDWVVAQALHIIDDFNVDWILQDGENMVKSCTKSTHSHDPADSNYSNAVEGVNAVLAEVQAKRPNVLWENCEDGGNMMTFNMVKYYVTSITNDASGAYASRQAVWGATFPFPTRYTDRYQPEDFLNSYITRSYMFGGPWHLMNKLDGMPPEQFALAQSEIQIYKQMRELIRDGKVFHLTSPGVHNVDAIQSYHQGLDRSEIIVCRNEEATARQQVKLRGLYRDRTYRVSFADDTRVLSMTGAQLMDSGVSINLEDPLTAEIIHIEPMDASAAVSTPALK